MEELLEILQGMHPETDFESCETLIDDDILDSFDIVSLISDISDTYDITIPADCITPENFNSASSLYALVERLQNGE